LATVVEAKSPSPIHSVYGEGPMTDGVTMVGVLVTLEKERSHDYERM
jgi:hypothetical protein